MLPFFHPYVLPYKQDVGKAKNALYHNAKEQLNVVL